jgi:hypothetical protein
MKEKKILAMKHWGSKDFHHLEKNQLQDKCVNEEEEEEVLWIIIIIIIIIIFVTQETHF